MKDKEDCSDCPIESMCISDDNCMREHEKETVKMQVVDDDFFAES